MRRMLSMCCVAALASTVNASDWYVDSTLGNNANSGASETQPWQTITWAIASVPTGSPQTIHVAAGVYSAASGEFFPLWVKPEQTLVGDAGSTLTEITGSSASVPLIYAWAEASLGYSYSATTVIQGFTLRDAYIGVFVSGAINDASPALLDLEVHSMISTGIIVNATATVVPPSTYGSASPTLQRVSIHDCGRGLSVLGLDFGYCAPLVRDCVLGPHNTTGVYIAGGYAISPTFEGCRIDDNFTDGVRVNIPNSGGVYATLRDCSISHNLGDGWNSDTITPLGSGGRVGEFTRCTIANNASYGVVGVHDSVKLFDDITLDQCIVYGNGQDTEDHGGPVFTATKCDIGNGLFNGINGCFAADPLFVNVATNDLRLQFGSPCIDAASSVPPAGAADALGHARVVDGNLDTIKRSDLGAFEFRPLDRRGDAGLGSILQFELWGPANNASTLYWTRSALASSPANTPFGQLRLVASEMHVYRVVNVGASAPAVVTRAIPNAHWLIGMTFSFQALTNNSAAPNGKAYTNPLQITIVR